MLKKLFIGVLILAFMIIGAVHYLLSNLDSIVKEVIEKYGSEATGTSVTLSSVHISTSTGEGKLSGLAIANPANFSSGSAFDLGSISVSIDTGSILGNGPIVIREIDIESPHVNFEVDNNGNNNLQSIQQNVTHYSASAHASEPADKEEAKENKPARKVIINDLYIRDGQMNISQAMLKGKEMKAPLPTIHLSNIGKDEGGASPAEVAKKLIGTVTAVSITDASRQLANQLNSAVGDAINKSGASGAVNNVGNQLKGLLR